MNKSAVYEELKKNPKNVHFNKLCGAAELFGFRFRGGKGSHRIYVREGIREALNFQNVGGWAKPYQVRQLLKTLIKSYCSHIMSDGHDFKSTPFSLSFSIIATILHNEYINTPNSH